MMNSDIHYKLYDASRDGNDSRVRELLAAGAEPDKYRDSRDITAQAESAWYGRDSTVSILIQHGADINRQNNTGWTLGGWRTPPGRSLFSPLTTIASSPASVLWPLTPRPGRRRARQPVSTNPLNQKKAIRQSLPTFLQGLLDYK